MLICPIAATKALQLMNHIFVKTPLKSSLQPYNSTNFITGLAAGIKVNNNNNNQQNAKMLPFIIAMKENMPQSDFGKQNSRFLHLQCINVIIIFSIYNL